MKNILTITIFIFFSITLVWLKAEPVREWEKVVD